MTERPLTERMLYVEEPEGMTIRQLNEAVRALREELHAARTAPEVRASRASPGDERGDLAEIERLLNRTVEAAVDAALGEVRRQGGADYLLREARTDGLNQAHGAFGTALLSAVRRLAPAAATDPVREALAAMERAVMRVGFQCHHDERPAWRADLLTAIDGLRALSAPAASMGEECEHCQSCGRAYATVWRAPDALWANVTGRADGGGLRCPECFEREAAVRGIVLYWECLANRFPTAPAASPPPAPEERDKGALRATLERWGIIRSTDDNDEDASATGRAYARCRSCGRIGWDGKPIKHKKKCDIDAALAAPSRSHGDEARARAAMRDLTEHGSVVALNRLPAPAPSSPVDETPNKETDRE